MSHNIIAIALAPKDRQYVRIPMDGIVISAGAPPNMIPHLFIDVSDCEGQMFRDVLVYLDMQDEPIRKGLPVLSEFDLDGLKLRAYVEEDVR